MLEQIVEYGTDWEFYGNIMMYVVVLAHIVIGMVFFISSKTTNKGTAQEHIDWAYGFWFIGIGLGYMAYAIDRTYRLLYNQRFFAKYDGHIMSSDYFIFAFFFLFLAFIFLAHALEKHSLGKKYSPLAILSGVLAVFTFFFRPMESKVIDPTHYPGFLSDLMGIVVFGGIALVFFRVIGIYMLILKDIPSETKLYRKTVVSLISIIVWVALLVGGARAVQDFNTSWSQIVGPSLFFIVLALLYWGFSRKD
jgi:hypothetical protein